MTPWLGCPTRSAGDQIAGDARRLFRAAAGSGENVGDEGAQRRGGDSHRESLPSNSAIRESERPTLRAAADS